MSLEDMSRFQAFDAGILDRAGLNRQGVFNIEDLPAAIRASIQDNCLPFPSCRQLILIGHGGRRLWEKVKASGIDSENPIDDFTVETVKNWFAACYPQNSCRIVYPGSQAVGLQALGQLAGWHNPSPFRVGIDPEWGTWYAYRAVVLADTEFEPSPAVPRDSPCQACLHRACVAACPAGALEGGFDLGKCVAYRRQVGSGCRTTCLARIACPVGSVHRYSDEQLSHTYSISLRMIEQYC